MAGSLSGMSRMTPSFATVHVFETKSTSLHRAEPISSRRAPVNNRSFPIGPNGHPMLSNALHASRISSSERTLSRQLRGDEAVAPSSAPPCAAAQLGHEFCEEPVRPHRRAVVENLVEQFMDFDARHLQ